MSIPKTAAEILLEKARCESSFHYFVGKAWPVIEGTPFIDGWHIKALCEHLEAVFYGSIKKLKINVPPRTGKTNIISILFTAWWFIKDPSIRFLSSSHSRNISIGHSRLCKLLIESPWYQKFWGDKVRLSKDQSTKSHFTTTVHGHRIATSVGAGSTALGGDVLLMDDPNDAKDGESKVTREATNDWYSRTWVSRLNPGKVGAHILVQQRLHEMDVSGFVNEDKEWVNLILPMEYEVDRKCKTIILPSTNGKVWEDPRTKNGELLCPSYLDEESIRKKKIELGPYNYAGQYQQRPAPAGGGILKREWFKVWTHDKLPKIGYMLQSWDTDMTGNTLKKEESSLSACSTWGLFKDERGINNFILLYAWQDKVEYPELLSRALRLYSNCSDIGDLKKQPNKSFQPDMVLIEAAAQGHAVIADFNSRGIITHGFYPKKYGDKENRVKLISSYVANGKAWVIGSNLKHLNPDHEMFVSCCEHFPKGEKNDIVDSFSQVFLYFRDKGLLTHSLDMNFERGSYPDSQSPEYDPDKLKKKLTEK